MNENALTNVPGFRATGLSCGIKPSGGKDLALIIADQPCTAAAMFTKNAFQAAPVLYGKALMANNGGQGLRAVLINAGNANACTGDQGQRDAEAMARLVEREANLPANSVFVMSTGVIGRLLPMDRIETGVSQAVAAIEENPKGGAHFAQAIMTTDTIPKEVFKQVEIGGRPVSLAGVAKGSGMIHPNMATMLSTVVTDANLTQPDLAAALDQAVNASFNRVSVDGDTSTNDTIIILAGGTTHESPLSGSDLELFTTALTDLCVELAKMIARDGEGATKLIEVQIHEAASPEDAALAAETVAISPLVKTAVFGNDPNWGRFLMAIGRSGAQVNVNQTALWLQTPQGKVQLVDHGQPLPFDDAALSIQLQAAVDVTVIANLGVGTSEATYWTCDMSYKYVEINAEYTT